MRKKIEERRRREEEEEEEEEGKEKEEDKDSGFIPLSELRSRWREEEKEVMHQRHAFT